jgi:hypothetical protein
MGRRWLRALASVLGVLALTVVAWPGVPAVADKATLPAEFATYSIFTSHAEDRPAGRAIAVFETGSWETYNSYQAIAVGADRDSYRQLNGGRADMSQDRPILLAPDGSQVLHRRAGGGPDEFDLLDLRTGVTTLRHGVAWTPRSNYDANGSVEDDALLAWSPDGRYVAYTVHAPPFRGFSGYEVGNPSPDRLLAIIDLASDRAQLIGTVIGVVGAAFAPDSQRMAVATKDGGRVISVTGVQLGTWTVPAPAAADTDLSDYGWYPGALGLAWSPDGATLAVATSVVCGPEATLTGGGPRMTRTVFLRMPDGQPLTVPTSPPCIMPLGWRSPTTLIGEQIRPDGGYGLADASLVDGSVTAISHFSYGRGCELVGQCDVWRIQLATNLLGTAGIRDSLYPDRGPWVAIIHIGPFALALGLVGTWLTSVVLRRRKIRNIEVLK